ncbi:MAG: hypothetical protein WCF04_15325 [Candidatus Nanopelagicales bacterium]
MARKFGWVRKLPSGRYQASCISPDGVRVNAPTTFVKEEHAEKVAGRPTHRHRT